MTLTPPIKRDVPDDLGRFGKYGGQFVPETLMAALAELQEAYLAAREDESFWEELLKPPDRLRWPAYTSLPRREPEPKTRRALRSG